MNNSASVSSVNDDLKSPSLSIWQVLAYGSVMLPLSMGWVTLMMFIPTYYAIDLGLGLGLVGVLFAAGRVFDIITDPMIGILTDKTRSRFGARKPWILAGLPLFCIAAWILLNPPQNANSYYLILACCLYFLSFTISEIPLAAMGLEISDNEHERTYLAASKTFFLITGGIIGAAIPLIWTESIPQALSKTVLIIIFMTLFSLPFHLWLMPNHSKRQLKANHSLGGAIAALKGHRYIQRVIGVFFILTTAKTFGAALSLLFISYILQMPDLVGLFWIATGAGMLCGLPLWLILSRKIGKLKAWRIAIFMGLAGYSGLLFLGAGDKTAMIIISWIMGLSGVADSIFSVSILADHVASEQNKGRTTFAGLVTAIKNATSKLSVAIPMVIAFPILGAIGLSEGDDTIGAVTTTLEMSDRIILTGFYAGVPLLLKITAFFAIIRLSSRKNLD